MKPSSFAFGLLRGFGVSLLTVLLSGLYIAGKLHGSPRVAQLLVLMSAAILTIYGLIALAWAWSWAEREGPVKRLTARSAGVAFGHLLPALVLWFAVEAGWVARLSDWVPLKSY